MASARLHRLRPPLGHGTHLAAMSTATVPVCAPLAQPEIYVDNFVVLHVVSRADTPRNTTTSDDTNLANTAH